MTKGYSEGSDKSKVPIKNVRNKNTSDSLECIDTFVEQLESLKVEAISKHVMGRVTDPYPMIDEVVTGLFQLAYENGLLNNNLFQAIYEPKAETDADEGNVIPKSVLKAFMKEAKSSSYYMAFVLAVGAGLRGDELTGLHWSSIKLNQYKIFIRSNKLYCPYFQTTHNQHLHRLIPFSSAVRQALVNHKKKYPWPEKGLVICNDIGARISTQTLQSEMNKVQERLYGLPNLKLNDLRTTYAAILAENGIGLGVVNLLVGQEIYRTKNIVTLHPAPDIFSPCFYRLLEYGFKDII